MGEGGGGTNPFSPPILDSSHLYRLYKNVFTSFKYASNSKLFYPSPPVFFQLGRNLTTMQRFFVVYNVCYMIHHLQLQITAYMFNPISSLFFEEDFDEKKLRYFIL